jgi:hypothetical protein
MTQKEYQSKVAAAKEIGTPVFLNQEECAWLERFLLNYAQALASDVHKSPIHRREYHKAVSIGLKCAGRGQEES